MAISSPGVGSGIDVNAIVDKLVSIERQPILRLQQQEAKVDAKLSAFGKLRSALSTLQDAARALSGTDTWKAARASSADPAAVQATATGGAVTGGYSVVVDALAQRQSTASAAMPATSAFAAGTLTIERGPVSGFAPGGAASGAIPVTIAAGDTLATVRDKINAAGAGVTASLVADGGGTRLVLRSADSGAANAFRVLAADAGAAGAGQRSLAELAVDPSAPPTVGGTEVKQPAADARLTVDGLTVTSASNRVTGVIDNVTLELKRAGPDPVEVQVDTDDEALKGAVQKFVDAWNALNGLVNEQTRYDAATKTGGPLQGDIGAVSLQGRLRGALQGEVGGPADPATARLSDIGVAVQRDGSLAIDQTKLRTALAQPDQLARLFTTANPDASRAGLGVRFASLTLSMLGTDGVISGATDSLGRVKRDLDDRQAQLEQRVASFQTRMLKQYTDLDMKLGQVTNIDWSKLYVDYSGR